MGEGGSPFYFIPILLPCHFQRRPPPETGQNVGNFSHKLLYFSTNFSRYWNYLAQKKEEAFLPLGHHPKKSRPEYSVNKSAI